jgi:hypothetical protein
MGYRSDVAYTIRFSGEDDTKVKQSFYTFLAEAKANPAIAGCFSDDEEHFKVIEATYTINFHADDVKWYESYEDVQCHEALMKQALAWIDDENECIGYIFARIGEEVNDTEQNYGGNWDDDWLYLKRELVLDW